MTNFLKRCCAIARVAPNAILGRPVWAFVWVTRQCEQQCEHCYVYDNSKPHMDFQLYQRVIDKLKALGIVFVSIFGGEPVLHPQLLDIIKYAVSQRRKIFLNTDIIVVPDALLTEIVKAGTNIISFSLDRSKPTNFNTRAIENIDNKLAIVSELQANGYDCALHCNVTWYKGNLHEGREVIEYLCEKDNVGISVRPAVYPFPLAGVFEKTKNLLLNHEDVAQIEKLVAWVIEKKKRGYLILNPYSYLEDFPKFVLGNNKWECDACRDILSVDVDGKVLQCSYSLQEMPEPFKNISLQTRDLTFQRLEECRTATQYNLVYCNKGCYSPAYYCTAYYRTHLFKLLKLYLKG